MIAYLWFRFEQSPISVWLMYHNNEFWINYIKEDQNNELNDEQIIFKMKQQSSNRNGVTDEDALFNIIFTTTREDGDITLFFDDKEIMDVTFNDCIEEKSETREYFDKMCPLLKYICNSKDDIEQLNYTKLPKEIVNMITKLRN